MAIRTLVSTKLSEEGASSSGESRAAGKEGDQLLVELDGRALLRRIQTISLEPGFWEKDRLVLTIILSSGSGSDQSQDSCDKKLLPA